MVSKLTLKKALAIVILVATPFVVTACLGGLFDQPPKPVVTTVPSLPYGTAPFTITFDISKSHDPDGKIVAFTFDFGDGSTPIHGTDLSSPITHTYNTAGNYLAKLTVVDNAGKQRSVGVPIVVKPPSQ